MEMVQHALSWFEIPVIEFERAKAFYSAIYDFEMPEMMMGEQRMGFLLFNQKERGIGGAIVKGEGYTPSKDGVKIYLSAGSDVNTVLDRVEDAGGIVLMQKAQITPDLGYFATLQDTEGNVINLHSMQ